jgi:hypothetical protein
MVPLSLLKETSRFLQQGTSILRRHAPTQRELASSSSHEASHQAE